MVLFFTFKTIHCFFFVRLVLGNVMGPKYTSHYSFKNNLQVTLNLGHSPEALSSSGNRGGGGGGGGGGGADGVGPARTRGTAKKQQFFYATNNKILLLRF